MSTIQFVLIQLIYLPMLVRFFFFLFGLPNFSKMFQISTLPGSSSNDVISDAILSPNGSFLFVSLTIANKIVMFDLSYPTNVSLLSIVDFPDSNGNSKTFPLIFQFYLEMFFKKVPKKWLQWKQNRIFSQPEIFWMEISCGLIIQLHFQEWFQHLNIIH